MRVLFHQNHTSLASVVEVVHLLAIVLNGLKVVHEPHELDEDAWRRFVLENEKGNIFQTPEMYQVYLSTEGHEPIFTAILNKNQDIVATMLGAYKEEAGSFARRFSKRVLVSGGPIIADTANRHALFDEIIRAYTVQAKRNALFTEVRNVLPSIEFQPNFEAAGYRYIPHVTTCLDLTPGTEELWNSLSSKRRQQIRKASKKGLTTCVVTIKDLDDLYALFEETYQRISFPVPRKSLFESVISILQSKNLARLIGVRHEERLVSVLVNLPYKDMIYAWYCAVTMEYARLHCNELMFWSAFEWGVENGFKLFDFGGGGSPEEAEDGVRVFKERMGGMTRETGRYECVHAPLKYKLASLGFKVWRAIR